MDNRPNAQIDLVANSDELSEDLQSAEKDIKTFGQKIQTIFDKISTTTSELKDNVVDTFKKGVSVIESFTASLKISETALNIYNAVIYRAQSYLATYAQRLQAVNSVYEDLARTNKLTGETAGFASNKLTEYAEYLQLVSTYSKEANESAMQLIMRFRNIHGDEFIGATKAAQNLATELKMDLNSAAQIVAQSLADPASAMDKLVQAGIYLENSEQKLIEKLVKAGKTAEAQRLILKKLEEAYGGAAAKAANTFAGRLERLKNVLNTIGTNIGQRVLDKLNQIMGSGEKGTKVFDAFLQKVEKWGRVAVAAVDVLVPKILDLVKTIHVDFGGIYDWLVEKTLVVFSTVQAVFQNAAEVIGDINNFLFESFVKVWNGISRFFTDIIPKAYGYMVEVFSQLSKQVIDNWKILKYNLEVLWENSKITVQQTLNDIYGFFLKFGIKLMRWGIEIMMIPFSLTKVFKVVIGEYLIEIEKQLDKMIDKYVDETDELFEKAKQKTKEFRDMSVDVQPPDFSQSVSGLENSLDLTQQWDNLLQNLNTHAGEDFRENMQENRRAFDSFVNEMKQRSEEAENALKAPDMKAHNKRRDDLDKKYEVEHSFQSGLTGLEDLWRNMSGSSSPEVKAAEKNTSAVEENTKELKKKSLKEREEENKKRRDDLRQKHEDEQKSRRKEKVEKNSADAARRNQLTMPQKLEEERHKKYIRDKMKNGMTEKQAENFYRNDRLAKEAEKDQKKEDKMYAEQERKEKLAKKYKEYKDARDRREADRKQFAKSIENRMKQTGETYGQARKNLEIARNGKNTPAEELAKQRQKDNELKQRVTRQDETNTKHLRDIARNTRNNVEEARQTKEKTDQIAKNTKNRNVV